MAFNLFKKVLFLGLILMLSACSTMRHHYHQFSPDRDTAYLEAEATPPLMLPEGITLTENYHSPYIIPKGPLPPEDAKPMTLVPPGGDELLARANAELEKEEEREEEE